MSGPTPPGEAVYSPLRDAFEPLRPQFKRIFAFSLITGLLALAPSLYMLQVYSRVLDSRSLETLIMLSVLIIGVFAFMETLDYIRTRMLHELGREVDAKVAPSVFSKMFAARLRRMPLGTLQPQSDWRVIREFLPGNFMTSLLESPPSLVFIAILFWVNPVLGWVALAGAILQLMIAGLTERSTQPPLAAANREAAAAQQFADDSLRNVEVVEAMGMRPALHVRWLRRQGQFLHLQAIASAAAGGYQAASRNLQLMLTSGLLGLACWFLMQDALRGGPAMMVVASILGARAVQPLVTMVAQWRSVVAVRDSWTRLNQLLGNVPERELGMKLPAPRGILTVESLVAGAPSAYGGSSPPILKGIQFALRPGEMLAVVGPSASGKTTLARLLVGLWTPMQGKVRIDGVDVSNWNKDELGPHIGYLPQDVELFEGTVGENIARFGSIDLAQMEAAVAAVGLETLLDEWPAGLDTEIGPEGATVSGGQRHRVALARAFYGDPAFVVLDEPNASLDEAGDIALLETLKRAKARGATIVVITHEPSMLQIADKMLVLADGTQRAFGSCDQVLRELQQAARQNAGKSVTSPTLSGAEK
jgi:ATP-binding cassette subfamily C exporter for protease/lipase